MPESNTDTLDYTALPFWMWDTMGYPQTEVDTGIPFDSIHRPREAVDTVFRTSLFQRHTLQVKHTELATRQDTAEPAWTFVALLLLTGLICLYYKLRKIKGSALVKSLFDRRAMDRTVRDCNMNRSILMLPMGLLLVAVVCMPIHRMAMASTGVVGYLLLAVGVSLLYMLRNGIFRLLGNTFENRQGVALYLTNNYLYNLAEATALVVLLFPFYYLPGAQETMLYVLGGVAAAGFVMRFGRGVKVFLTLKNRSSFYLFYYLCIVELVPILVILKWFIEQ